MQGLGAAGALIVAIGAQNVFVLRHGIRREHVLLVVLVCSLCDAALIALGGIGMGAALQARPILHASARWAVRHFWFSTDCGPRGGLAAIDTWPLANSRRWASGPRSLPPWDFRF